MSCVFLFLTIPSLADFVQIFMHFNCTSRMSESYFFMSLSIQYIICYNPIIGASLVHFGTIIFLLEKG